MDTRLVAKEKQLESWATIVRECRNSGMKTKDWLAENNISKDQYYYWFRLLREQAYISESTKPASVNQVVKIECSETHSACVESTDVITINTAKMNINIPCHADVNVIKAVVEVAMSAK